MNRVCSVPSCDRTEGVELHHLYSRKEGCPDDLVVPLYHVCHGRAHGMRRRIDISELVKKGIAKAKEQGFRPGEKGGKAGKSNADFFALKIMKTIENIRVDELLSSTEVAEALNSMGVRTRRKNLWTSQAVVKLVRRIRGEDAPYWWRKGPPGA